jgi:hypothetical protein
MSEENCLGIVYFSHILRCWLQGETLISLLLREDERKAEQSGSKWSD